MGTRATYQIDGHCFYIHWDGYLEGAAGYFHAAIAHENKRGGLAERFLRANPEAEFTAGHHAHADTEFRYTVKGTTLQAQARATDNGWANVSVGDLAAFVNAHKDDSLSPVAPGTLCTVARLQQLAVERLRDGWTAADRGQWGNASSLLNDAFKYALAAAPFDRGAWLTIEAVRMLDNKLLLHFPGHTLETWRAIRGDTGQGVES